MTRKRVKMLTRVKLVPAAEPAITPAALRYLAADFACNADHPLHRERLKEVVRKALEQAADELEARK